MRYLGAYLTTGRRRVFAVLIVLAVAGVICDGWHAGADWWLRLRKPSAIYRQGFRNGIAVSLNSLEKDHRPGRTLPGFDIRGVLIDRPNCDWIIFGEADPHRPRVPVAALAVAIRALHGSIEPPGIDIRAASPGSPTQKVKYFGGVENTVVGVWFFTFDSWMKRVSMGRERPPVPGMISYWDLAVEDFSHKVAEQGLSDGAGEHPDLEPLLVVSDGIRGHRGRRYARSEQDANECAGGRRGGSDDLGYSS